MSKIVSTTAKTAGWLVLLGLAALPLRAASVTLAWDAVTANADGSAISDLAGYNLYFHTQSLASLTLDQLKGSAQKVPSPGAVAQRKVELLADGTTYYFRVTAYDVLGNESDPGDNPLEAVVYTPAPDFTVKPNAPTGFSGDPTEGGKNTVWWNDVANNEKGFVVLRSETSENGPWTEFQVGVNATGYMDTAITPSTKYFYRVYAWNDVGSSPISNYIVMTSKAGPGTPPPPPPPVPMAPSSVTAAAASWTDVTVSWQHAGANLQGFHLEWSLNGTSFTALPAQGAATRSYAHAGRSPNTRYYYRVRAHNGANSLSAWSPTVETVTPAAPAGGGTTASEAAPDAQGVVDINGVRADFALLPQVERPKLVQVQVIPSAAGRPATTEPDIDRTKNGGVAAMIYDIRAGGREHAVFSRPVRLTLRYVDADGNGMVDGTNIPARLLRIFHFDGIEWRVLGGKVDEPSRTVSVMTAHFSVYALFPVGAGPIAESKAREKFLSPSSVDGANDVATFGLAAREIAVFDATGRQVHEAAGDGTNVLMWNARDDDGRVVESGSYIVRIKDADGKMAYQAIVVAK